MRLDALTVKVDKGRIHIADADDFRVLTGKALEQYVEDFDRGRKVQYFDEILDPDIRAMIWVFCRDPELRERVWEDPDELWRTMERDIRMLTIEDIENATEHMADMHAPAVSRARRPTAAQTRAAKRDPEAETA